MYRGVYCMSIRQFKEAATLFLDTIATFTSYELMDYPKFVTYTVLCSVIALERPKLREKVTLLLLSDAPGNDTCSLVSEARDLFKSGASYTGENVPV